MSDPVANPGRDPVTDPRAILRELADGLEGLHHALLEEQRRQYEQLQGPILGGGHLLHLVARDPSFAWLRSLSTLMVDLDFLLDEEEPPSAVETGALYQELEELFSPATSDPFWPKCSPLLQAPAVAMAYGRVRLTLNQLPRPPVASDTAADLHARHRWAVARRMRGTP
jgi:hypothetical protein